MATLKEHDRELSHAETSRRRFLARNVLAIGAIAATALANMTPASANGVPPGPPPGPPGPPVGPPPHGHGPNCFLKGTRIRTVDGDRNIEDIVAGDLLPTLFGATRSVQWVGRYVYKKTDAAKPWNNHIRPVRIARSALAPNVPHADLFVTSWHALLIDDVLIPAGNLINGTTITLYPANEFDELEYFHIKLETHDVIYALGAPCETLTDVNEGASNFAEYYRTYGPPEEEEALCAPLLCYDGRRAQIKSRLRSAISPWLDRREKIDVIRDRLEERGIALCKQLELQS
jgi:Hint domain